jgi:hypothetical protein
MKNSPGLLYVFGHSITLIQMAGGVYDSPKLLTEATKWPEVQKDFFFLKLFLTECVKIISC